MRHIEIVFTSQERYGSYRISAMKERAESYKKKEGIYLEIFPSKIPSVVVRFF
jgi:hypothetical protein